MSINSTTDKNIRIAESTLSMSAVEKEIRVLPKVVLTRADSPPAMTSVANINEIKEKYLEYTRIYQRLQRNGDLEQKKVGRKPVSPEHKKATYERWLETRKKSRREQAILEGRNPCRGRPKKIQSENLTCVQV